MPNTHVLSDAHQIDQLLAPASRNAGTVTSAYFDLSAYEGCLFEINVGAISATGTIQAQVLQAQDAAGTNAKNLTAGVVPTVTDTAGNTAGKSNGLYLIEFRTGALDLINGFRFVALQFTTGVAANLTGAVIVRHRGRVYPVTPNAILQVKV